MKIILLYNSDAGEGMALPALREDIERQDHEILHIVENDADLGLAFDASPDLVVAAGGDGTVSRAARALAGRDIPLAIVPIGTANNIAVSLGIDGPASELIARWREPDQILLDVGLLQSTSGERPFIEGAGVGLVTAAIAAMQDASEDESGTTREAKLAWAARGYLDVLERLQPSPLVLTLDDTRIEGEFLLVEALNIPSIGPNLVWSGDADPSDGFFTVVTASEAERDLLTTYLQDRIAGGNGAVHLPTRRARRVHIEALKEMHVDDDVRCWSLPETISMEISSSRLRIVGIGPPLGGRQNG